MGKEVAERGKGDYKNGNKPRYFKQDICSIREVKQTKHQNFSVDTERRGEKLN